MESYGSNSFITTDGFNIVCVILKYFLWEIICTSYNHHYLFSKNWFVLMYLYTVHCLKLLSIYP